MLSVVGINANAPDTTLTVDSGNVRTIYTFRQVAGTDQWYQLSKDVQNGSFNGGTFTPTTHTFYNYAYNDKRTCATTPDQTAIDSCATLIRSTSYADAADRYPLNIKNYRNDIMISQQQYFRNADFRIREYRIITYHANGNINKYTRYYAGKQLQTDVVSYNKIHIQNRRANNQILSNYHYENSWLWNGKKATVAKQVDRFTYYSNGKTREVSRYYRSTIYNTPSKRVDTTFAQNGNRVKSITRTYDIKGVITKKVDYRFNKAGQLRSTNKDGNAFRYITNYKNGKSNRVVKQQYNASGKLQTVR